MGFDLQTIAAALLAGFVLSLAISQAFQLVIEGVQLDSVVGRFAAIAMMLMAGPHILAQAAQKSARRGDWPSHYVYAVYGLSIVWAAALGLCVLAALTSR